jgi:signal transduction histidine kinase
MEMKLPPDDPNREMVEHMKQDTDRLAHLMDSVLTFSRSTETKLGPMDLKVFLDQLVSRWRPRMYRANVNSELHIPPEIPRINGNEKSLEQVFTNLFTNALRAMAETGGTLSVRVKLLPQIGSSRHLQVDVSDTGIGIPPENLDTIFNPFFTTDPQGTGLGLAITQRIITAHKGSITVDSFPGGGTVFHIELPIIHSSTT